MPISALWHKKSPCIITDLLYEQLVKDLVFNLYCAFKKNITFLRKAYRMRGELSYSATFEKEYATQFQSLPGPKTESDLDHLQ